MNRKIVLLPLSVMILGLTACDLGPSGSSEVVTPSSEIVTTSEEPGVFDGGIKDIEIDVDCMISGVVANVLSNGNWTIADGMGSAYVYGAFGEGIGIGDYVNVSAAVQNYYGQREIASPTVTKREDAAPALPEAVEITGADVQAYREAIDAAKNATPVVGVSPEMQKAYKVTNATAINVSGQPGFAFDGVSTKLCAHYYASQYNRTAANRDTKLYVGGVYDVYFYPAGTSSQNNVQMHIYDVVSHYEAVESVAFDLGTETSISMSEEDTKILTATVLPANSDKAVTYTVADTSIATVSGSTLTAVKAGDTTVTVASVADPTKTATVDLHVSEKVTGEVATLDLLDCVKAWREAEYAFFTGNTTRNKELALSDKFTLKISKSGDADAGNSGKLYISTNQTTSEEEYAEIRLYSGESPVLTIEPAAGVTILRATGRKGSANWAGKADNDEKRVTETFSIADNKASYTPTANCNFASFEITYELAA